MLIDQARHGPFYITPLFWGFRVESGKTHEVPLDVGIRIEHSKGQIWDEFRLVETNSGTEIRFKTSDVTNLFSKGLFSTTLPVPAGRYTIQWKRDDGENWYTVVEGHEYDGKGMITVKF